MIWKMNKQSFESSSESSFQQRNQMCSKKLSQLSFQMETSKVLRAKRKRCDSDFVAKMSPSNLPETSEMGVSNCGYGGGIPVECPDDSNMSESPKINKKELRTIRMQIAMISDSDGDRPIHMAVVQQNLKLVRKLCAIMLKTAISLDLTNYLRQTALHLAVMTGNIEMIQLLLKCGSSVILRDRNGNSVIHLAVKTDVKKDVLCLILSHPHANRILDSLDYEGYTALHYAVLRRNKTAVTCLLLSGANMNVMDGKSGRTALIHAVMERNKDMVTQLLECGANIGIIDYSGRSAFELALQTSNDDIVKLLERKLLTEEFSKSSASSEDSEEDGTKQGVASRTKKSKHI